MRFAERAVVFDCMGEQLIGIVAEPEVASRAGLVIIVGGPQYRTGSHRQFVLLARKLAAEGVPVMRFDYRGMGDASGPAQVFDQVAPDVEAAIGAFAAACPALERVLLMGLCDAASACLTYFHGSRDARVAGMVLLNPWVRSDEGLGRVQIRHYYTARLTDSAFWKKLARGGVDVHAAMRGIGRSVRNALGPRLRTSPADAGAVVAFQDRMAEGLRAFAGPVLLIMSGRDLTAREFEDHAQRDARWAGLLTRPNLTRLDFPLADHTFSSAQWRAQVESATLDWVRRMFAQAPP